MFSRRHLFLAIIAAVACVFLLTPTTFGCNPLENESCETSVEGIKAVSVIQASSLMRPLAANRAEMKQNLTAFANQGNKAGKQPQMDDPATVNVAAPQNTWVHIGPGSTVWFKTETEIKRLTVGVDSHNQAGLELSVYSPEQHDVQSANAIGHGTRENGFDLWWSGSVRENGTWYFKLRNDNDFSVPYNLVTRTATDGGQEYRPNLSFAFGTGDTTKPAPVSQPAPPMAPPPAAATAPEAPRTGAVFPEAAQEPNGTMEYIEPGQILWYKMFTRQRLYVWVDTGGQQGIELAIFPPDTTNFWGSKPVGLGSKNRNEGKDLFWTGRAPGAGTWYARVTNKTDVSIPITVDSAKVNSRLRDFCTSCHGNEFDFETCESKDPAFCEEFLPSLLQQ